MAGKECHQQTDIQEQWDKNIMKVTIHHCELKSENLLVQPVVCLHVVDSTNGSYIKKQDRNRAVMSFYENQRGDIDYIMPIMSQPCTLSGGKSQLLKWEESFILNESLEHLLKKELKTILFFEVIDLIPVSFTKHQYERLNENGMQKKAWAFLKVLGSNDKINTGSMLRLQLYKPYISRKKNEFCRIEVFHWWSKKAKVPLPASLYISFERHGEFTIQPALRSMLPQQEEIGLSGEQLSGNIKEPTTELQDSSISISSENKNIVSNIEVIWSRKKDEECKIPTMLYGSLDSSNSCQILKFSSTGRSLVAGCEFSGQHYLHFYEIPSKKLIQKHLAHSDVIYDLDWSQDDSNLLTASADCSVKLWNIKPWILLSSFIHPSYVYSAKFQPPLNEILVTACYDHVIRIWTNNKCVRLLQELEGHSSAVNTLSWHVKGLKLFSADNNGEVKVWKMLQYLKDAKKSNISVDFVLEKDLNFFCLKGISVDKMVLDNCRDILFLFCGDGFIRLVDVEMESILFCYKSISKSQSIINGCCSPCGNLLFVCNDDGRISVWNSVPSNIAVVFLNTLHPFQLTSIDYHPFEHMIAVSASEESGCVYLYMYDESTNQSLEGNELRSVKDNTNTNASNLNESFKTISKCDPEDVNEACNDSSQLSKGYMYDDGESIDACEGFSNLSLGKRNADKYISNPELVKSTDPLTERKKIESFTAIITKAGQFDVISVADSCTESDNLGSGSQSSKSIQPDNPKKHSKRSLRRKKLQERKT